MLLALSVFYLPVRAVVTSILVSLSLSLLLLAFFIFTARSSALYLSPLKVSGCSECTLFVNADALYVILPLKTALKIPSPTEKRIAPLIGSCVCVYLLLQPRTGSVGEDGFRGGSSLARNCTPPVSEKEGEIVQGSSFPPGSMVQLVCVCLGRQSVLSSHSLSYSLSSVCFFSSLRVGRSLSSFVRALSLSPAATLLYWASCANCVQIRTSIDPPIEAKRGIAH